MGYYYMNEEGPNPCLMIKELRSVYFPYKYASKFGLNLLENFIE